MQRFAHKFITDVTSESEWQSSITMVQLVVRLEFCDGLEGVEGECAEF